MAAGVSWPACVTFMLLMLLLWLCCGHQFDIDVSFVVKLNCCPAAGVPAQVAWPGARRVPGLLAALLCRSSDTSSSSSRGTAGRNRAAGTPTADSWLVCCFVKDREKNLGRQGGREELGTRELHRCCLVQASQHRAIPAPVSAC